MVIPPAGLPAMPPHPTATLQPAILSGEPVAPAWTRSRHGGSTVQVSAVLPALSQSPAAIGLSQPLMMLAPAAISLPQQPELSALASPVAAQPAVGPGASMMMSVPGVPFPMPVAVAPAPASQRPKARSLSISEGEGGGGLPGRIKHWMPRPENFNWISNWGAGVIMGMASSVMWNWYEQTKGKNSLADMHYRYYELRRPDNHLYRMTSHPLTPLEKVTNHGVVGWVKGLANWFVPEDMLNVHGAFRPATVLKSEKTGPLAAFVGQFKPVVQFSADGQQITHLASDGQTVNKVINLANAKAPTIDYHEATGPVKREVYEALDNLAGYRLQEVYDLKGGLPKLAERLKPIVVNGEHKAEVTLFKQPGNVWQALPKVIREATVLKQMSEWLPQRPINARLIADHLPIDEMVRRFVNLRSLVWFGFVGGLLTSFFGITNQPHHTVIRMGD